MGEKTDEQIGGICWDSEGESQTPFETVPAGFLLLVLLNRDRLCRLSLPWVSAQTDTLGQALSREAVQLCGSVWLAAFQHALHFPPASAQRATRPRSSFGLTQAAKCS